MTTEPRYRELEYWFPVPEALREECREFVEWLCEHAEEIDAEDVGVNFEMLCRMDELEGDIAASKACGGIDSYAASWLRSYYTRGGIFNEKNK